MSTDSKEVMPFPRYVASFTLGSILEQSQREAAQSGGETQEVDGTSGMKISAMVLVTCCRAGLKYPKSIPVLLYPDDVSSRRTFSERLGQDACGAGVQAALKLHKTQSEVYKARGGEAPSILMAMLTNAVSSTGRSFAEFVGVDADFPLDELFDIATACGQYGLVLPSIDESEARKLVADAVLPPWEFDEAGHVKYADSILQSFIIDYKITLE